MSHVIAVDLAQVFRTPDRKGFLRMLTWGDPVEVLKVTTRHVEIRAFDFVEQADSSIRPQKISGFIVPSASSGLKPADVVLPRKENRVLKVDFVDVQQGDGSVVETPKGKVVLLDGGDNQLFARYLAGRFRKTTAEKPKEIDAIVVSHGDADHFEGLTRIHESETHETVWKRLFIHPKRVFHNGLVKRPSKRNGKRVKEADLLGPTRKVGGATICTGLVTNLLQVPDADMNARRS